MSFEIRDKSNFKSLFFPLVFIDPNNASAGGILLPICLLLCCKHFKIVALLTEMCIKSLKILFLFHSKIFIHKRM